MDPYRYTGLPITKNSRPVGKTTMSKMAVTRTPDGRTTISRMPIYRTPVARAPLARPPAARTPAARTPVTQRPAKKPKALTIVKGNLFPRVVLEDCVSFKRKYEGLLETERRRMAEREERDEREAKEMLEREEAMEREAAMDIEMETEEVEETAMETETATETATETVTETAMDTAMDTATETAMEMSTEPATETIEEPLTLPTSTSTTQSACGTSTSVSTAAPSTSTVDPFTVTPSTSWSDPFMSAPSTSAACMSVPSTSAASTSAPSTSAATRTSLRRSSPRKSAGRKLSPRRSSPRKASTRKSSPRKSSPRKSSPRKSSPRKSTPRKSTKSNRPIANKRRSWDPTQDYEIDRIVGYHRDRFDRMWYFVQWKGWPGEYNTYEPIENMTGCNFLLMKYFEYRKPSDREFNAKDREITAMLDNYEMHQRLIESNFKKEDLDEFSRTCLDLSKMFKKGSFVQFCKKTEREFNYIIRCLVGMCKHQDQGLIERAMNYKIALKMIKLRRKQLRENLASQRQINRLEVTEVKIENYTDLDIFPKDLTYVVDLKPGQNVIIPTDPTVGCDCERGCSAKSHCCGEMASTLFAYNKYGRVRSLDRFAIYECNRRCTCPPQCVNRVVQHGMKFKLCIFKTESCGWGVKTLERIPKGAFICEYIGELISDADAVVRDIDYYKKNSSYIFDLDFNPDHDTNMYCIDATKYGNLARFINHSCDPNLVVYPVWIDCLEPNLHRLAFFARRAIKKNEELCIDYENAQDGHVPQLSKEDQEKKSQRTLRTLSRIRCQCGAERCREWVFGN